MLRLKDLHAEVCRSLFKDRTKVRAVISTGGSLLRYSERWHGIEIEIEGDVADGDRRMLAEIFGTEESLLFGGDCREEERTPRFLRRDRSSASHLDDHR